MQLTILGCSGSLAAPGNPASSYVISVPGETDVVMDFGPGALAAMQERFDPSAAHVIFSHLHADHCSDFPSLLVWRRYHPSAPAQQRHRLIGPSYALRSPPRPARSSCRLWSRARPPARKSSR